MKNPYLSLQKTAWSFAGKEKKKYLLIYAMFICANCIFALNPLLFGWFVGKVQHDTDQILRYAMMYAGGYLGLKLLEWCLHGPARTMERTLAFNISRNYLQEKYHRTLRLSAKWHQENHSGATINRLQKAYDALRGFFDKGFVYIYTLTKFVLSVAAILYFSPLFGSVAIVLGIINIFLISRFDKAFIKSFNDVNERERRVSSNLFDSLSNIRTVISLRLEGSMEKGLMQKLKMVFLPFRKNAVINEWKWFVAEIMVTIIYCVVVVGFVYQHWERGQVFYVAGLVTLLGYVNQFTSVFQSVAGQYTEIVQFDTNLKNAEIIDVAFAENQRGTNVSEIDKNWQVMDVGKLNFSYQQTQGKETITHQLHNLGLQIERGKKIALIGESGCGKSTLLTLLRGIYQPETDCNFSVDGHSTAFTNLYDSVTLFPQEPEIFENTIAYNITLGLPCSELEMQKVCAQAQLTQIIDKMPEGVSTEIKEKGANLSGGQKQRLALARGILAAKDSKLVLLDEPTSSIDPRTEMQIYDQLFHAFKDKAVISSLHRLHLLPKFDYIYIMDKGRIVAEGSFDQLLSGSSVFNEIWEHQRNNSLVELRA
jgi:ATP-binding cassette subfamily B protein